jgi:hypothetical protein
VSDFRKLVLAFAAVTLLAGLASAQVTPPITCNTTAQPLTVRAEGLVEQTGDIVISCTGGQVPTIGSALPQVNISVTLTTNITGRLLNDPITEALLFIDDPGPAAQGLCTPASGTTQCFPLYAGVGGTATLTLGSSDVRNVFQGVKENDNTIVWLAVPINAPGATGQRIFRTKRLRGSIFAFFNIQFTDSPGAPAFVRNNTYLPTHTVQIRLKTMGIEGQAATTSQNRKPISRLHFFDKSFKTATLHRHENRPLALSAKSERLTPLRI